MKKLTVKSFDFIKSICALGIIAFHFSCYLKNTDFFPLYSFANGSWGGVLVTVFFIVSGGVLYHNYFENINVLSFYKKRFISIFPMFYLAYAFYEINYIISHKTLMYRGNIVPYIFTLIGMDGYLSGTVKTYYILGEWFLGAIILLYILFPIILYFFKKNSIITFSVSVLLYVIFLGKPIINSQPFWSITSCLVSFVAGMFIVKYKKIFYNIWSVILSTVSLIILCIVKLPLSKDVCYHLTGITLFIVLNFLGEYIMKICFFERIFKGVSKISYAVFLLQHLTILKVLKAWNPASPVKVIVLLVLTTILILCEAKALTLCSNYIVTKLGYTIEKFFKRKAA